MIAIGIVCAGLLFQPLTGHQGQPETTDPNRIVIDGEFDDWRAIAPTLIDPADAPDATIDFGEVRITHNDRFVHLLIDVGRNVNLQGMRGTASLLLDVDGDPTTGTVERGLNGVDVVIDFSPAVPTDSGRSGLGVALRSTTYQPPPERPDERLSPYDIGLTFSPTYASRRFEIRMERGDLLPQTPPLFEGKHLSGKWVFVDSNGTVADEVDVFTHELGERTTIHQQDDGDDPLARSPSTDLRVLSWNIQRGAIVTNSDPFIRVIRAVKPDVVLLQELRDTNTVEQIKDVLQMALPLPGEGAWHVKIGAGGGDLRCGIASRYPIQDIPLLETIPMLDRPDRTLRVVAAFIEHADKRLLVFSIHLKCCGVAGGSEDEQRIAEANALQAAMMNASATGKVDGLIIGGDFNLVGSRDPLEVLAMGADLDRSNLSVVPTYQLDRLSNVTWRDRRTPFTPGRLDFMMFGDSRLDLLFSTAFESNDLTKKWIAAHGLQVDDTDFASDHLPLIADVKWR